MGRAYVKSCILLPPQSEWAAIPAAIAARRMKRTVCYSADDAGIGPPARTVVVVNPEEWDGGLAALERFFAEHYPGATLVPVRARSSGELMARLMPALGNQPLGISQRDPRWASRPLGETRGTTIGEAGCLLCGLTMAIRQEYQCDILPHEVDELLVLERSPFTEASLVDWDAAAKCFGFVSTLKTNTTVTAARVASLLSSGWRVIVVRLNPFHAWYVLGVTGNTLSVINPATGLVESRAASNFGGIRALARTVSSQPPTQPSRPSLRGGELLTPFILTRWPDGLGAALAVLKPAYVKLLDWSLAPRIRAACEAEVIGRPYRDDATQLRLLQSKEGPREYLESLLPDARRYGITWVEGLNETCASGNPDLIRATVKFESEFAARAADAALRPVCLNAPVRNLSTAEVREFLPPLILTLKNTRGALGVHAYWGVTRGGKSTLRDLWLTDAGRFTAWLGALPELKEIPIFITECGAVGVSDDLATFYPYSGWRDLYPFDRYLEDLLEFRSRLLTIPNVGCAAIFAVADGNWESFHVGPGELQAIAAAAGR